jgi:DNA-binding MarR family transcriptional regulator
MDRVERIVGQWQKERPDLDTGPMALLGRLRRVAEHASRCMEKTFARHGLNGATFDVLASLRRCGPPYALSPGELLATMMITSGTMTNRIDQLEKAGLVRRTHNPDDRRSVIISLTDEGFAVVDAAVTEHVATQQSLVAGLSKEDMAALDGLLGRYLVVLEGQG